MWKKHRCRGILLIWANLAICLMLLLGGAALLGLQAVSRQIRMAEEETEMALLLQEAMETVKYNRRFGKSLALPAEATRNGRTYAVNVSRETISVEGIPLEVAVCTVSGPSGESETLRAAVGRAGGEADETE